MQCERTVRKRRNSLYEYGSADEQGCACVQVLAHLVLLVLFSRRLLIEIQWDIKIYGSVIHAGTVPARDHGKSSIWGQRDPVFATRLTAKAIREHSSAYKP